MELTIGGWVAEGAAASSMGPKKKARARRKVAAASTESPMQNEVPVRKKKRVHAHPDSQEEAAPPRSSEVAAGDTDVRRKTNAVEVSPPLAPGIRPTPEDSLSRPRKRLVEVGSPSPNSKQRMQETMLAARAAAKLNKQKAEEASRAIDRVMAFEKQLQAASAAGGNPPVLHRRICLLPPLNLLN